MPDPIHLLLGPGADADAAARRLQALAEELGVAERLVRAPAEGHGTAGEEGDPAVPALRVAGLDVPVTPGPAPDWLLQAALLRALRPRHLLFLCVANSARSQMAEGIARSLAPEGVRISSAGSVPTRIRPQAVQALAEIGIDAGAQRSKGTDEVGTDVDAVITLCAEEVCPLWLHESWRIHWGLPDPAGAGSTPEEEMQAFRDVRDELRRRFAVLFDG